MRISNGALVEAGIARDRYLCLMQDASLMTICVYASFFDAGTTCTIACASATAH